MTKGDHLIWTNYALDYDDYKDQLDEDYPDLSDAEKEQMMYSINDDYLLNVKIWISNCRSRFWL